MAITNAGVFGAIGALVIILDPEGRIVHWNRACSRLLGYRLDEVRGRLFWQVLRPTDEQDAARAEFARVTADGDARLFEHDWLTKEGTRRGICGAHEVARGPAGEIERVVATGIDRTERKETEQQLRSSEATLHGILSIAADAIISIDEDQRILLYSDGAEQIFGWTSAEARGQRLDMLIPERFRGAHRDHVGRFASAPGSARRMGERRPEIVGLRKSGDEFAAEAAISKLKTERGWVFTVTLRDVSDRKALEMALRREIQARDELTRTVGHELRSPLASISLQTEALRQTRGHSRHPSAPLDRILEAAGKMKRLLDDLLDATRSEARRLCMRREAVALSGLLREAIDSAAPSASDSDIALREDIEGSLPRVWADRVRVLQILDNLVANAIKFTPAGGVITFGAEEQSEVVCIRVSDTGPGLSPEQLSVLFEPFWQAEPGDRRGTGLGLSIAKGIVEAHGGRIWADSAPGSGATFSFTLPKVSGA